MTRGDTPPRKDYITTATLLQLILVVGGLGLIAVSLLVPDHGVSGYVRELLKETGIVLFAVFSVSLLYERLLAERHQRHFLANLREEITRGEGNAAMCGSLGILRFFLGRHSYEAVHPLPQVTSDLTMGDSLRIFGKTLFITATKAEVVKSLLARGVTIELCLLDPSLPHEAMRLYNDVAMSEIVTSLDRFKTGLRTWLMTTRPPAKCSIRFHHAATIDSYFHAMGKETTFEAWEWSFGPDLSQKRILVLDSSKPLGRDVAARYERLWLAAEAAFSYDNGRVLVDQL
jgi:hypothetical protein